MPAMTLEEAQALECNGCGDCCDSRRLLAQGIQFGWGVPEADVPVGLLIPLREIKERLEANESVWTRASSLPRCTWYDVWIYDPSRSGLPHE